MNTLTAQVGLIHGSGFELRNGQQELSTASRANAYMAALLLLNNSVETVVCSGRGPVDGVNYRRSEADLMADYVYDAVRPVLGYKAADRIDKEEQSTSTIGNWAHSAELIEVLGDTVLGITAKVNIPRMQAIGQYVAAESKFELVGYQPSLMQSRPRDYARETVMRKVTNAFFAKHADVPLSELETAYNEYKDSLGIGPVTVGAVKRLRHRNTSKVFSA